MKTPAPVVSAHEFTPDEITKDSGAFTDTFTIARYFDKAAASYQQAAILQQQVGLDLLAWLPDQSEILLDVGCGPGWLHPKLVLQSQQLWAMDLSLAMLEQAQKQGVAERFIHAAAQQVPLETGSVSTVFSSLMLQWCQPISVVLTEMYRLLSPGGTLVLSTLVEHSMHEFTQSWAQVDTQSHQLDFLPAAQVLQALSCAGFNPTDIRFEVRPYPVFYPDIWSLVRHFKQIGANYVAKPKGAGLRGKTYWQQFGTAYEQFRQPQGLPLTYQVLLLEAKKGV